MTRRAQAAAAVALLGACTTPASPPTPVRPPAPTTPTTVAATTTTAEVRSPGPQPARVPPPEPVASPAGAAADPPEGTEGAQTARASWYARGTTTASGERFDPDGLTYASRTDPFGTLTRFCHDGRCVVARANDRGPAEWTGRRFDLSRAAFAAIAPLSAGVATVTWEAA